MDESSFKEPSNFFTDEKPIKSTGTTCDAFSARYESRHVFVKRLKPEHASNSRYRLASQKEYELGVSLRHPSIPQYIKFTGDTLITEFVDGKTLHQIIQDDDPRLHSDRNIEKWVSQLLDVMDYLHARNVIHCDIKTDNIMITNDTRNLMLIDFDKAFTASQDLTPGTPLNYGKEDENITKRQMDIRGVRDIIEKLRKYVGSDSLRGKMEKVVLVACSPDVTMPELLEDWKTTASPHDKRLNKNVKNISLSLGAVILIALLVIVWSYLPKESPEVIQPEALREIENHEITIPKEKEVPNIEDKKEKIKPESPDWESLLASDVEPMNRLFDKISFEIQTQNISRDNVPDIVLQISDEWNTFNKEVVDKYSSQFQAFGRDKILLEIYDTDIVNSLVTKRDKILERLIEIQETSYKPE